MRYQKIHSQIWHDEKILRLSQDAKLLFLYILTSPHSNSIGIYVLPKMYICADLKWDLKQLGKPFRELLAEQLIEYDETVSVVVIFNHIKHNSLENPNQIKAAEKMLLALPKSHIYQYVKLLPKQLAELLPKLLRNCSYTEEREKEEEKERKREKEPDGITAVITFIINYMNQVCKTKYKPTSERTGTLIKVRLQEGFTSEDFKTVIDKKYAEWGKDEKMVKFLRPETLFGNKFEGYLNQMAAVPNNVSKSMQNILAFAKAREEQNDRERNDGSICETVSRISGTGG